MLYVCFLNVQGFWIIFSQYTEFDWFREKLSVTCCCRNTQISNFASFTLDSLETVSDSVLAVKAKNAPFFMNFSNFYKKWQLFFPLDWSYKKPYLLLQRYHCCIGNGNFLYETFVHAHECRYRPLCMEAVVVGHPLLKVFFL